MGWGWGLDRIRSCIDGFGFGIGSQLISLSLGGWRSLLMYWKLERFFFIVKGPPLGTDEFPWTIFQDYWDVGKEDFFIVSVEFFENGVVNTCPDVFFICWISKEENSIRISDFKTISLVASADLRKDFGKVLSTSLRLVLGDTISASQGAFIDGCQILDVVLVPIEDYRGS